MSKEKKVAQSTPAVQMAKIPVEVLNSTLQYLATKPYAEVVDYINAIRENSKIDE